MTYGVAVGGRAVAVTALTLLPGATVTAADLAEAVGALPVGLPPDIIHVVKDLPLSATYRPNVSDLRAAGLPKPSRQAWHLDAGTGQFKRLTSAVRSQLAGG
jgi:putative long chain acyl-CoA synthase